MLTRRDLFASREGDAEGMEGFEFRLAPRAPISDFDPVSGFSSFNRSNWSINHLIPFLVDQFDDLFGIRASISYWSFNSLRMTIPTFLMTTRPVDSLNVCNHRVNQLPRVLPKLHLHRVELHS